MSKLERILKRHGLNTDEIEPRMDERKLARELARIRAGEGGTTIGTDNTAGWSVTNCTLETDPGEQFIVVREDPDGKAYQTFISGDFGSGTKEEIEALVLIEAMATCPSCWMPVGENGVQI